MVIDLKEYQDKKVDELVKVFTDLLPLEADNKLCVFQSPTGSGKTVMVAKFIETLKNAKELPSQRTKDTTIKRRNE